MHKTSCNLSRRQKLVQMDRWRMQHSKL